MIHFIKRKLYSECPFCKLMIPVKAGPGLVKIHCVQCYKDHFIIVPHWYL